MAPNQMKLGHMGHLNARNKFMKDIFFPNSGIFLSILDELEELGFGENGRYPPNRRG
jgi:hypothetical protein